jgi:hypothetical protein
MLKKLCIFFAFFLLLSGCFYMQPDDVRPVHTDPRVVMNGPRYIVSEGRRHIDHHRAWIYVCERHRYSGWTMRCYWRRNYFHVTHH